MDIKKIAFICPHEIGLNKRYENGAYKIGNKEIHIVQGDYFEYKQKAMKAGIALRHIHERHDQILLELLDKFPIQEMDKIVVYAEPPVLEKILPKLEKYKKQEKVYFVALYQDYDGYFRPKGYIKDLLKKHQQQDAEIVKCDQWAPVEMNERIIKEILDHNSKADVLERLLKPEQKSIIEEQ